MNFIETIVENDLKSNTYTEIITRFPPEPNGYLHIGSAYAIHISYKIAQKYNGKFNLRFDDTNPAKEDLEFVKAIQEDMLWLGIDVKERVFYGSDYHDPIYHYAEELIKMGKAYVCDLSKEEIKSHRGTYSTKGVDSPYRNRSVEENLTLLENMKKGFYKKGERVLRAKIDMSNPNMNLRDPVIYRISYSPHYRTGSTWCIYPMYDFAHPIQDYLEHVTHSLCSIEFKNHRPLYEWVLKTLDLQKPFPKQIEFGRLNLTGIVTSKRYLKMLVEREVVDGWDDPRLSTLKGLRRRGYTKESISNFLDEIGVAKVESTVDLSMLEHALREDLKKKVSTLMAIIDPIKVSITNLPNNYVEYLPAENNKENSELGIRHLPFTQTLYIEREDFMENPSKDYYRLVLGGEVRLMHAYFITCQEVIKDAEGNVVELLCTYDEQTKSGSGFKGRKVKGTIHWVSATYARPCEIRLYEDLFTETPKQNRLFEVLNPHSLIIKKTAFIEPRSDYEGHFQFIRHGYFVRDTKWENLVFNRTVSLKSNYQLEK